MIKRKSWQDYQKEIADDHYYYARSCIRQNFFPGSEKLFIDMLRNDLGRDLTDDPLHSSCTGIGYHSDIVPLETIMTVVARQFALMTEAGYENLVSSCITSFGVYSEILATWHEFPETEEKARESFGFLMDAYKFGAPPHGGMAYGLDRMVMLMLKKDSIRDVIAFPKVQNAGEPMSGAPDVVDAQQLSDLSIALTLKD